MKILALALLISLAACADQPVTLEEAYCGYFERCAYPSCTHVDEAGHCIEGECPALPARCESESDYRSPFPATCEPTPAAELEACIAELQTAACGATIIMCSTAL